MKLCCNGSKQGENVIVFPQAKITATAAYTCIWMGSVVKSFVAKDFSWFAISNPACSVFKVGHCRVPQSNFPALAGITCTGQFCV